MLLNANGSGSLTLNVPAGVRGALRAQAIVIDAGAVGGYTVSNGVEPQAF